MSDSHDGYANASRRGCDPCGTEWDENDMGTHCFNCGFRGMEI